MQPKAGKKENKEKKNKQRGHNKMVQMNSNIAQQTLMNKMLQLKERY